jgi:hypothetical protein
MLSSRATLALRSSSGIDGCLSEPETYAARSFFEKISALIRDDTIPVGATVWPAGQTLAQFPTTCTTHISVRTHPPSEISIIVT